ncbi:plant/protein [Thalictrum thalictroides]|uniref:Plant/protein n=1 Tax=Thalictrum thalictroides TaxID=46969 RepID=A0A7J6W4N1_THATH|nr:plant/protein [Thalictrum thalictroides]
MSLSLVQNYSSAEEDEEEKKFQFSSSSEDEDNEEEDSEEEENEKESILNRSRIENSSFNNDTNPSNGGSLLPSALDAFSEVAGPPEFLNNCVSEHVLAQEDVEHRGRRGGGRHRIPKDKKDLPVGVVVEAKAQLVGIRERVRSDVDGNCPPVTSVSSQTGSINTGSGEGKRVVSAANPDAKDAAELLRMCLQCGIPKTYSNARGMVCPVCGDRPPTDPDKESDKKKGSTIKDKEKNKRMKGQSSHSSWKSETEMQLRQQFD